jgi:hypothetical protein
MKTTIISIVIALVIGSGAGYSLGTSANDTSSQAKELQDSVAMMKEQSASIRKMGGMMKSSGIMMQEMGMQYKDDNAVSQGKDLEMMGKKYMEEDEKALEGSGGMKNMMGH